MSTIEYTKDGDQEFKVNGEVVATIINGYYTPYNIDRESITKTVKLATLMGSTICHLSSMDEAMDLVANHIMKWPTIKEQQEQLKLTEKDLGT